MIDSSGCVSLAWPAAVTFSHLEVAVPVVGWCNRAAPLSLLVQENYLSSP